MLAEGMISMNELEAVVERKVSCAGFERLEQRVTRLET